MTGRYDNRTVKILRESRDRLFWICVYTDSARRGRPRKHGLSEYRISKNLVRVDYERTANP